MRDFPGKQYTNLDATQVIRTGEHADGCRGRITTTISYKRYSGISAITKICNKLGNLSSI
ncbi:hypothetical protein T09_11869 [Trichinella sp. T9]|nr:hypothetical protein T09_11869 [Trichinella sp. T9]